MKKIVVSSLALMFLTTMAVKATEASAGCCAPKKSVATAEKGAVAPAAAQAAYPLDTCVVSGEKLGEMGEPIIIQHEGREVRFCCKMCIKKFKQDPAKYLKLLDDAEKSRAATTSK